MVKVSEIFKTKLYNTISSPDMWDRVVNYSSQLFSDNCYHQTPHQHTSCLLLLYPGQDQLSNPSQLPQLGDGRWPWSQWLWAAQHSNKEDFFTWLTWLLTKVLIWPVSCHSPCYYQTLPIYSRQFWGKNTANWTGHSVWPPSSVRKTLRDIKVNIDWAQYFKNVLL